MVAKNNGMCLQTSLSVFFPKARVFPLGLFSFRYEFFWGKPIVFSLIQGYLDQIMQSNDSVHKLFKRPFGLRNEQVRPLEEG